MGPTLWNLAYDAVLKIPCSENTRIIGFADDTFVMAWGKTTDDVETKVDEALLRVVQAIHGTGLELAVDKSFFKRQYLQDQDVSY